MVRPKFSNWVSTFIFIFLMFWVKSALADSTNIIITAQILGPTINNVTPASGLNSQVLDQVVVSGTGFNAGTWVKLSRAGFADVEATSVLLAGGTSLACTLDLRGVSAGLWDVVVYPNGETGTLPGAFTVVADADADWLPDDWEASYGVDDPAADIDGDGLTNMEEYFNGTDPTVDNAALEDLDQDSLPDAWESFYGVDDPSGDPDGDGLSNLVEYFNGTNPLEDNQLLADADADGLPDIWERANGLDPDNNDALNDPDQDTLSNEDEYLNGTDPWASDSDGDSIGDGTEVAMATEPLNPASVPDLSLATSRLWVTDVTSVSFSLVWIADQSATGCYVNVYADSLGNSLIKNLNITDKSADHPPAAANGVLKVEITGLAPDTTYYFRTVTINAEGVLVEPGGGTLLSSVRTEVMDGWVENDSLYHRILQSDGSTHAEGALLLAQVAGASYPITGWVGEDISPPQALLNLNNLYSQVDHMNLELDGGEDITLLSIGGAMGFRLLNATVPPENWGYQPVYPDDEDPGNEPTDEQCTLDVTPPVIDTDQLQPVSGSFSADDVPVISASYSDYADQSDVDLASVRLLVDSVDVTDEATVDSQTVQYSPPTPLAEGSHTVTLEVADQWGYETDPFSWNFTVDMVAPESSGATLTINSGASYSAATTLDLAWSGFTDSGSGIAGYYYSLVDGSGTDIGIATSATTGQLTGISEGVVQAYVWAFDAAGNIGQAVSDSITVDLTAPSAPSWDTGGQSVIVINGDSITLGISAESVDAYFSHYQTSTDGTTWTNAGAGGPFTFTLLENSSHTLYLRGVDFAGNTSAPAMITVEEDSTPPSVTSVTLSDIDSGSDSYTNATTVKVTMGGVSGEPSEMMLAEDGAFSLNSTGWVGYSEETTFTFADETSGVRTVFVKVRDTVQNESAPVADNITLDTLPPAVDSFSVADTSSDSQDYTNSRTVNVSMAASDAGGTVAYWLITESPTPPTPSEFIAANITNRPTVYDIAGAEGFVNIYGWVMDDHGNVSELTFDSQTEITLDFTAPVITVSSPADGAILYPATQTITGTIDDPVIPPGTIYLNGTPHTISFDAGTFSRAMILEKGLNFIAIQAIDLAGNLGSAFLTVMNDHDGDGLGDENDPDDDNDGMPDTWELDNGFDPYDPNDTAGDIDRDTLSNEDEFLHGTDPWASDSDGDTIGDGTEVTMGTEPMNPASVPEISLATSRLWITDVTPVSFSLVWIANQPATGCFANIYADSDGNSLIKELSIEDESYDNPPAAEKGVLKVRISGLDPDTTYYFRTVTVSNEGVLVEPANTTPLSSVRTELSSDLVENDGLYHRILQSDGTTEAQGALLLAEVPGASYPITAWVGDGILAPRALLNLNNLYSQANHINLELNGGEDITLLSIGGAMGFRLLQATVPGEIFGGFQGLDPEPTNEQCTLDTTGPSVEADQVQPSSGSFSGDDTPVISANYADQHSEVDPASVRLLVDSVDVSAQATVDSGTIQYTPTTPLAEGGHSVSLSVADQWGYGADPFIWTFSVDLTPPVITIISPTHGDYLYPPSQTVRWSINEENLAGITCTMNGNSDTLTPDVSEHPLALEPGANVIEVAAMDQAGNSTSESIQVMLDDDFDLDGIGDHSDADDDNDRLPDIWEEANELNKYDPIDSRLDSDGDGHSNLTEYSADTDPQDPGSYPLVTLAADYITVTDVTPEGFSVIWQATEPSTCGLEIFDESGSFLGNLDLESESAIHPPAEDNGVMKVRVSGLAANTVYRFQTLTVAKASGLALLSPAYPEVVEVVTEAANATVANDLIKQRIYDEDDMDAEGTLLVVSVAGGDFPISSWVGEDIASPWARVDLNRIYSSATHENLQLLGDEELRLWSFGGLLGNYLNIQKVPAQTGEEHVALPEVSQLSSELGYHLDLNLNLNIVGLPVYNTKVPLTSHSLLLFLQEQGGGAAAEKIVTSIKRRDPASGTWQTTSWFGNDPAGPDFLVKPGEAYLIYMKQVINDLWFEGVAVGSAVDLGYGLNLVCLPAARDDFTYTSYDMLQDLGTRDEVASVKRYSAAEGWETTSWIGALPAGDLYVTGKGDGYLFYMRLDKLDWRPY